MSINELYKEVEKLLEQKSSKYANDPRKQLLYERGYVVGLLLRLAQEDSYTLNVLKRIIKNKKN